MIDSNSSDQAPGPPGGRDITHYDVDQLRRWHLDQLDAATTSQIEAHLIECEECATLLDQVPELGGDVTAWIELGGGPNPLNTPTEPTESQSEPAESRGEPTGSLDESLTTTQRSFVGEFTRDGEDNGDRTRIGESGSSPDHWRRSQTSIQTIDNHDRWQPVRLIAQGGVGEVWLARDRLFQQRVVIKRLRSAAAYRPSLQARLTREAQITAEIDHPGTVTVFDRSDAGPDSYYVMTLIEGSTLRSLIAEYHQQRSLAERQWTSRLMTLIRHFLSVADTLAYAHLRSIVHRDVKSENVVVGEFGQVTLIDWGLAKRLDDAELEIETGSTGDSQLATVAGTRMGTPAYMSPEQVRGESHLTASSDVYGLAAMLFETVTGSPPMPGDDCDEIYDAILTRPPRSFADFGIFTLPGLEQIVARGLSKRPEDRQPDASTLANDVRTWLEETVERQQQNRLRENFFSLTSDLMVLLDRNHAVRWINPAVTQQLRWDLDQILGVKFSSLIHPDQTDAFNEQLDRLVCGGTFGEMEPRMRTAGGDYRWCLWTASYLTEEKCTYLVGRDIHERHRREATRRTLLDGAPDAMVAVDRDRVIRYANSQCESLFGYRPVELMGQRLETLIPERFRPHHPELVEGYTHQPRVRSLDESCQLFARHRDGHDIPVLIRLSPIRTEEGELFVAAIRRIHDETPMDAPPLG